MDEILLFLLKNGAHKAPFRITTIQLASDLRMSQQNASRRLIDLERSGFIERKGGIRLTKKATDELSSLYAFLKSAFEGQKLEISGKIAAGLGEGRYYLSLIGYRRQIKEKLGFDPYPGTLNLSIDENEIWKRQFLLQLDPIIINGFKDGERTYGDLFAYRCKVDAGGSMQPAERSDAMHADCAIVVPLRTHHPQNIIEIIAPDNLKEKFRKKDGELIKVIL